MLTMNRGVLIVPATPLLSIHRLQLIALRMGDDTMHIRMDLTGNHLCFDIAGQLISV